MKIAFLGDSITEGYCAEPRSERYSTRLCRGISATELNYGISATRIARQKKMLFGFAEDDCFIDRADVMPPADFVFMFGGTNDYGHGDAEFGSDSSTDEYTFLGALNSLTDILISKYGKEKLCYILPLPRFNEDKPSDSRCVAGLPLSAYREAIRKKAESVGIDVLDLSNVFYLPSSDGGDKLFADGLHPNNFGHGVIADGLEEYLKIRGIV